MTSPDLDLEQSLRLTDPPLITPNIDENSPILCWPRGAPNPVIRKRKRVPERPLRFQSKRPRCRNSSFGFGETHVTLFQNRPVNSPPRVQPRRDKTKRRYVMPPPPLQNPYNTQTAKSKKDVDKLLKQHCEFHRLRQQPTPGRYQLNFNQLRVLNEGSFGTVFHVRERNTGLEYAVKKVKKKLKTGRDIRESFHEVFALSILDKCPYINRFYSAWVENSLFIQLEYCHGGCVHQLFLKNVYRKNYCFTDSVCIRIIRHVMLALNYMHARSISHLDIKPQNIFIRGDKTDLLSADFVLGDFGNARSLDCSYDSIELGDGSYLAPELLQESSDLDLAKVDVFGVGASVYQLMHKNVSSAEWENVRNGNVKLCKDYDPALMTLVKKMINRHPVGRPGVGKILHDPLICNSTSKTEETNLLRTKLQEAQLCNMRLRKENDRLRRKKPKKTTLGS